MNGPIVIKEVSSAKAQIESLNKLLLTASPKVKAKIEQDIKMLNYGVYGEEQIMFELKNSHMPMCILHDLYLEYDGLTAQIDFLIITEKITYIIESKNLIGNIEIDENGNFIRYFKYGGQFKKEGIYSPISQNNRHIEMIKQMRKDTKTNFLKRALFERYFSDLYQGVVVLANPKTILNDKLAPKTIKQQVIRVDRLIEYIRSNNAKSDVATSSEKEMKQLAEFFLSAHKDNPVDYLSKYELNVEAESSDSVIESSVRVEGSDSSKQEQGVYDAIKNWRNERAKKDCVKAYIIFYNTTLDEIVAKKPQTMDELKAISGFGEVKCQKYGEELLQIVKSFL